jgi:hypothetical protein
VQNSSSNSPASNHGVVIRSDGRHTENEGGNTSGLGSSISTTTNVTGSSSSSLFPPSNYASSSIHHRLLPNMQSHRNSGRPSCSSSTSPTSTCSSPLVSNVNVADASGHPLNSSSLLLPNVAAITPPQSAPPQKTGHAFFMEQQRLRSKSGCKRIAR